MARTKQTARKAGQSKSSKGSKLADPYIRSSNPDAVYPAQTIVAFIDENTAEGYALAQLQDDALETEESVQVTLLQETEQTGDSICYTASTDGEIQIDRIIRDLPYKVKHQRGRNNPDIYHIERAHMDGLSKLAADEKKANKTNKPKEEKRSKKKKREESESSESGSGSDEESSEGSEEEVVGEKVVFVEDTPRVLKRVKGKKSSAKKKKESLKKSQKKEETIEEEEEEESDKEEEEEEEEKPAPKRGRGRAAKKDTSVSRASKKKASVAGGSTTKKIDFDSEEEESEDEDEDEEKGKNAKNAKNTKKGKEEEKEDTKKKRKPKSTQRKPVKTIPDTYKKGKFNTKVEVLKHHDLLHNKSNTPIDYGCTATNNKNLIRAVETQNYTLLQNILEKKNFLSSLHQQWGPENDTTALSLAIKKKDVKAVKLILDCEFGRGYHFTEETPIKLENVDTGNVSKTAFGVEIRKVNLMRGAREGNNAFTHDMETGSFDFDSLFELPMTKEILDYLRSKAGNNRVIPNIHKLILAGDRVNAGYLVNLANSAGGYGFNYLHEEALLKNKASDLTPNIKRVSVTKKVIGNSVVTPLHCAAINPNPEILDALLQIAPDYSIPDEKMRKLIHYAACCEKPGPLKLLISKGVDPREKDHTGLTPFMYACYYGRAENVEYLLKEANVDPHMKTKDGMMGAHWAALKGHLGVLKILVENEVKMSAKGGKSKMTPLHFAAAYGYYDCVDYLVEHKSRVLAKDKFKRSPLCVAVRNGNLQIASYLLFNGSDFEQADSSNNYPLHYAAAYGFTECIDILVKAGADVNVTNSWKLTALTVAMLKSNFHCVKALLAYPATDVNAKDDQGRSLVSLLIDDPSDENFERIAFLIKERNCDVNTGDENGLTPLHYACQLQAEEFGLRKITRQLKYTQRAQAIWKAQKLKMQLIRLLLEIGADVNARTKDDQFPLLFAITNFDKEVIELLIGQEGIDIAFHDGDLNNFYRLLYSHTIDSDDNREFLKRMLQKVGNISNLLNEEKNDVIRQGGKRNQKKNSRNFRNFKGRGRPQSFKGRKAYSSSSDESEDEEEEVVKAHAEDEGEENEDLMEADPTAFEPTSCNESAFTCYKRTLMNHVLQNYLDTEQNNTLEAKRQKIINEEREKQRKMDQSDYYGGGGFGRNRVPSYAEIQLTEDEIAEYKERAYNQFDEIVTKNLDLIGEFVKAGGMLPLAEALLIRGEYSNDPRFMVWVLESFKTDLNIPDEEGNTAIFHLIARKENLQMTPNAKVSLVSYLTSQGLDADTLATYSDFRLFLEIYHRFGADFNFRNKNGITPILALLKDHNKKKNIGFLQDLVAYGADVHQAKDNDGSTAFLEAAYAKDLKVMEKLVELEADINHKDKSGKAVLHYISEMKLNRSMDAAHIVVKLKNIDIDIRDEENARTPLMYSVLKGARGLAKIFLQAGADPNKTDKDWCNSLYFATQVGDAVMMREVSETIHDPTFSGFGGFSPLHLAIQNGSEEHVEALLKIGANPNAKDNTGITALMAAVIFERLEIVKILLENGGNPNERDDTEKTCLHYAVNNSKPEQMFEMEDILIRNNADINAVDMYGRSPLHYAFIPIEGNPNFHNQNDPVETVTSLGTMETVNVNLKDRRGKTPLHYAAENGAYICVLLLLKKEVAFDEPDADGNTPLALSLNAGHKDTAAILIQNKASVTNMIHRINHRNYLWVHPKDKNYDDLIGPDGQLIQKKNDDQEIATEKEGKSEKKSSKSKSKKKGTDKMELEQQDEDDMEEEREHADEDEEEEDKQGSMDEENEEEQDEDESEGGTEDLEQEEEKKAIEMEIQGLESPIEDLDEEERYERKLPILNLGQVQRPVDSFFAISIRKGWQGIAYLLLQNGFNLMEAIRDALNEHQFKYVVALMTKVQVEVVRKTDHNGQNLFHIFAMKGQKAPLDLAKKIFDGLMKREVDYKIFDSFGRGPIHYAAENNFVFLEDKLLENKVDSNILDQKGYSILHLATKTNNLSVERLQKLHSYHVDLNAKFNYHGRDMTALHHIAERGVEDVEREMMKLGADPNIEDSEGYTPIQRVFIKKRLSVDRIKTYINNKTDINKVFTVKYKNDDNKEQSKTYTLLIYAAEKCWDDYEDVLLKHGGDASIINSENMTAFEIALHPHASMTLEKLRLYILCMAPLRKPISCKIRRRKMKVTPVLYLLNTKEDVELVFLKELLDAGVSINDADEDGYTAIIYAIRRNNMPLLKLLLEYPDLDKNMKDRHGKTPIHHVVTPMDYASYENTEMLGVLAAFFDVNAVDDRKKPPIYYAHFQDSDVMMQALLDLGAIDNKPSSAIQRQATSIIAGVDWLEEIDFEADAEKYIASQEDSKMNTEKAQKEPVDDCVHNRHNLQVVVDGELGPYSLYMTKVDIKKGGYGEYIFYRMQVLYDKNRDNYILLTKWGRIGDDGMHQETPFGTKDECINEFLKIFKDKSGNEWKNKARFQKFDHKFKLLNVSNRKSQNDYLQPIDWDDKKLPPSKLEKPIKRIIKAMADVKMYHQYFGRNNIDAKLLPFGKLSKEAIFEAKKLLLELRELIEEIEGKSNDTDEDVQVILKLKEKIMDKSSKYYELIPDTRFRLSPVQPIETTDDLEEKVLIVNDMLDFEVASKILLGSLSQIKITNPIDYSFEALGIRLLPLVKKQREYKLISQYIKNGCDYGGSDFIVNIFALERRGEAERISQWKGQKNRMYLWHGSKMLNFMGILSQGLRIAPPEAPATGYMFGKGIYFADTFSKSYGYCSDYYSGGSDNTKLLVLCEVALGEIWEQREANYVTKLPAPYNSVLGRGSTGPDPSQNIVLANGAIVPLGKQIDYPSQDEKGHYIDYSLSYNEYIVYDISQVRMRYLVQVK